jgi:hypothetical protein
MKAFFFSLFLVLLGGCASGPIPPVAGESLQGLRTERIAASYTLAEPKISYQEQLYRVLWVESKVSSQDFSGVWTPDPDLSNDLASQLKTEGFSADSVYLVADKTLVESAAGVWAKATLDAPTAMHPTMTTSKLLPAIAYFGESPKDEANLALMKSLREKGYRYWVQLISMDLRALSTSFVIVEVAANSRVIDLQSGKVVWTTYVSASSFAGNDLKALETDGMKKTKEAMKENIGKMKFASLWGFSTGK